MVKVKGSGTVPNRGYARNTKEEQQLIAAGLKPDAIYLEGRGAERLGRVGMRSGELLATVDGLRALGSGRQEIVDAVKRIHKVGAAVVDIETGERSDRDGVEMLHSALMRIRGERVMPPGKAEAMQALSVQVRTDGRLPHNAALVPWRNPLLSTAQAIQEMPGWTSTTAYRTFGPRGVPAGRRGLGYERRVKLDQHKRSETGAIYFCRAEGRGPVKIGWSLNIEARLSGLQTSHHSKLTLIAFVPGTRIEEKALHKRFQKQRIKGEWFKVEGALKRYLETLPKLPPEK